MLNYGVKTVIDQRPSPGKLVVFPDLVIQTAAGRTETRMIDDAGSAPPDSRPGAGVKIITDYGAARIQAEVGVNIDAAGNKDLPHTINNFPIALEVAWDGGPLESGGFPGTGERTGIPHRAYTAYQLPLYQDIPHRLIFRGNDQGAANKQFLAHR
jgi:hypothetical protein